MGNDFSSHTSREFRGPGARRLSRFIGGAIDFPDLFGGGYDSARITCRVPCVVFGYPSVFEEFESPTADVLWCALSVSLDGLAPTLRIDHRGEVEPRRRPAPTPQGETGRSEFERRFAVTCEPGLLSHVVSAELCSALLSAPVQRVHFSGQRLLIRTFDATGASAKVLDWLTERATVILQTTPGYTSRLHPGELRPFPRGVRGLAE